MIFVSLCLSIIAQIISLVSGGSPPMIQTFIVSGKLIFPSTGDYSVLPEGTCLQLNVTDQPGGFCFPQCSTPKQRGTYSMKTTEVVNNELFFDVECFGGDGFYYLAATLFVGRSCKNAIIKDGDYFAKRIDLILFDIDNISGVEVPMKFRKYETFAKTSTATPDSELLLNSTTLEPKNISKSHPTTTTTTTTTIKTTTRMELGFIILIAEFQDGIYKNLNKASCLHVIIEGLSECDDNLSCKNATKIFSDIKSYDDITVNINGYSVDLELDVNDYLHYRFRLLFNNGWCSSYNGSLPIENYSHKDKDFYNDGATFDKKTVSGDYTGFSILEVLMKNEDEKKLCGNETCYRTEVCKLDSDNVFCHCNDILVSPTIPICRTLPMDAFCGSDGETYKNSCYKDIKDCFSKTIKKLYKGACIKEGLYNSTKRITETADKSKMEDDMPTKTAIGVGLGGCGLCSMIIAVIIVFLKKRKQKNLHKRQNAFPNRAFDDSTYADNSQTNSRDKTSAPSQPSSSSTQYKKTYNA